MIRNPVIIPRLHMNGTSKKELLKQLTDANEALETCLTALARTSPNGRDYYHTGNLKEAEEAHYTRMETIRQLQDEIMRIAEGIADQ